MDRQLDFSPRDKHLSVIEAHFGGEVRGALAEFPANPAIRPTQALPIIRRISGDRSPVAAIARWGFIPPWSPARKKPPAVFNTCCEEAATAPRWRYAWRHARCLIPATAWYEGIGANDVSIRERAVDLLVRSPKLVRQQTQPIKQQSQLKIALRRTGGGLIMFAGLHGFLITPQGNRETVSILTNAGPSALEWALDRIPVALTTEAWGRWLDPDLTDPGEVRGVLDSVDTDVRIVKAFTV